MKTLVGQRGLSSIGWLCVLGIAAFCLTCFFKLGPVYLDDYFVDGALLSLSKRPGVKTMTPQEIKSTINKEFTINNVRGTPTKSVVVKKTPKKILVTIEYEERIKLFFNVDVVLSFSHMLDTTKPELCCKFVQQ